MINWAMKPLTEKPSIYARDVANKFDEAATDPQTKRVFDQNSIPGKYEDFANKFNAQVRGGIAGGIEGVGDLLSGMTSPLSIAGSALGVAPWLRGSASAVNGLSKIAPEVAPVAQEITTGVGPTVSKIPEFVAQGAEDAFNAGRSIYKPMRTAEEIAYDNIMRNGGRSSGSGGNLLLEHMQKVNAARGK